MKFGYITKLCVPLAGYLIVPIVLPWFTFVSLRSSVQMLGVPLPQVDNGWACELTVLSCELTSVRAMYPITTTVLLVAMSWRVISAVLARVRQWMIDAEYVVEERVENYEPGTEAEWAPEGGVVEEEGAANPEVLEQEEEWEDVVVLE